MEYSVLRSMSSLIIFMASFSKSGLSFTRYFKAESEDSVDYVDAGEDGWLNEAAVGGDTCMPLGALTLFNILIVAEA